MASHLHVKGCEGCETLLECPMHRRLTESELRKEEEENARYLQEYEDSDPVLVQQREEFYDSYASAVQDCIDRRR